MAFPNEEHKTNLVMQQNWINRKNQPIQFCNIIGKVICIVLTDFLNQTYMLDFTLLF